MENQPEACLHELVEAAARCFPAAPAIIFNGKSIRYDELMLRANRLASHLRQHAVGEGSIVALYLPRSPDLIAAQLAVLKSGAAYLPLDRSYPPERNRFVLADAHPAFVLTLRALAGELEDSFPTLLVDDAGTSVPAIRDDGVSPGRPDFLAYVVYTSGSTGQPKGVLNHHRGAVNYIAHMVAARQLQPGERVLQFTSLSFDASVRDTLGALAFGGTIILLDDEGAHDPLALLTAIRDDTANVILSIVPTMLRTLTRTALRQGFASRNLRLIMVSGEALLRADVEEARQAFGPGVQIVNQYGATECSMVAADYLVPAELPAGSSPLPIGGPIANNQIYILNRDLSPVPHGAEGDVYIGGLGVSWGYLNRPDLTAELFLVDPYGMPNARMYRTGDIARRLPDGPIQYLDRSDQQVKVRGNRVELGEIESVLREHPAVREAAVLLCPGREQGLLAAYVTLNGDMQAGELRAFLAGRMPFHMIPAAFVAMDRLPLTPNGKVDRGRLPRPSTQRQAGLHIPARNPVEARLVSLWESVLGVERVGVRDDFFELGGDSLMAVQLFTGIELEFGRALEMPVLFQNGTIEALATLLEKEGPGSQPGVVPLQPLGSRAPLFLVPAYLYLREFALCFAPHRPVYGLQADAPFSTPIQEEALAHYRNLVAFHPDGPYLLMGHSAGGYIALEIARLLIRDGKQVQFLGLLDTFPPGRRRKAAPLERLRIHFENLRGRNVQEVVIYFLQSAKRRAVRTLRYVPGSQRLVGVFAKSGSEPWVQDVVVQNYTPRSFPGGVTLFVVGERPSYVHWDPMERWGRYLTGNMEIVPIEGSHLSLIRQPRASLLARKVEGLLS